VRYHVTRCHEVRHGVMLHVAEPYCIVPHYLRRLLGEEGSVRICEIETKATSGEDRREPEESNPRGSHLRRRHRARKAGFGDRGCAALTFTLRVFRDDVCIWPSR